MSRNGSGSMSIPNTFTAGTTAVAADVNENFEDIGDEITNSVAADGQTSMTGALKAFAGTEALPGLSFATDTDTGIRRSAANTLAVVCNANDVVTVEAAEVTLESGVDLTVTAGDTTLTDGNLVMTSGAVDFSAAVDVASAATANIGAAASNTVNMTGTETITSLGTAAAGVERWVKFNGATLTHNATSLILPGAANITTAAGDTALFKSEGSGNWRCYGYQRANGKAVGRGYRTFIEETAPSTPASGNVSLYAKSDGALYSKDDAGNESPVTSRRFVGGPYALTLADLITVEHSLGVKPTVKAFELICQTGELGYSAGDIVQMKIGNESAGSTSGHGVQPYFEATDSTTKMYLRVGSASAGVIGNKTTGATAPITAANWKLRVTLEV